MLRKLLCLFLILFSLSAFAQEKPKDTLKRFKFSGFPVLYYAPETKLAFGLVGINTFKWKDDLPDARVSNVTVGLAYTLNKQLLIYLPFTLYLKQDHYRISGEVGYYDYNYYFFGIGNQNPVAKEKYHVSYPRIRLNTYRKLGKSWFGGIRWAYDRFGSFRFDSIGVLQNHPYTGTYTHANSGLGFGFQLDTRDQQFYPKKGFLGEFHVVRDDKWTGSAYQFTKVTFDIAAYKKVLPKSVIAANFNTIYSDGDTPFYLLGMLGGGKRLRGIFEGQYRDNIATQLQAEWRQEFLKNWGVVAFGGVGVIAHDLQQLDFSYTKFAGGVGIRYKLNKKDHVNIRVDVGFAQGKILPYVTLAEAF